MMVFLCRLVTSLRLGRVPHLLLLLLMVTYTYGALEQDDSQEDLLSILQSKSSEETELEIDDEKDDGGGGDDDGDDGDGSEGGEGGEDDTDDESDGEGGEDDDSSESGEDADEQGGEVSPPNPGETTLPPDDNSEEDESDNGEDDDNEDDNGEDDNGATPTTPTCHLPPLTVPSRSYCTAPGQSPASCTCCFSEGLPRLPSAPPNGCMNRKTYGCFLGSNLIGITQIPPMTEDTPVIPDSGLQVVEQIILAVGVFGIITISGGVVLWAYRSLSTHRVVGPWSRREGDGLAMAAAAEDIEDLLGAGAPSSSVTNVATAV